MFLYYNFIVPPSIVSSPDNILLYTGDTTTMNCEAEAIPDPSVTYFYNGSPLPSNAVENGELILSNVTSADNGVYQCFAQNTHGSASASWTVMVTNPSKKIVDILHVCMCLCVCVCMCLCICVCVWYYKISHAGGKYLQPGSNIHVIRRFLV